MVVRRFFDDVVVNVNNQKEEERGAIVQIYCR